MLNDQMDIGGFDSEIISNSVATSCYDERLYIHSKTDIAGKDLTCFEETEEDIEKLINDETEYNNSVIRSIDESNTELLMDSGYSFRMNEIASNNNLSNDSMLNSSQSFHEDDFGSSNYCSSIETCPSNLGEFVTPLEPIQIPSRYIDLQKYFVCNNNNCSSSKIIPTKRQYDNLVEKEIFNRYEKKRSNDILQIIEELFEALGCNQHTWFSCLIKTRESRKKIIDILKKSLCENEWKEVLEDSGFTTEKPRLINSEVHEHDVLYFKDNNLLSFLILHNLRKECNLMHLPNIAKLRKVKTQFDELVEKHIKSICAEYQGHMIDLEFAIKRILWLYKILKGSSIYKKKIFFKLCVDGRTINGNKQVAVALVPLNLRDVFPTQSVLSVFYIGLFLMSESEDSIEKTIGTLSDKIKQLATMQFDEKSTVKLIYVSDMHNVGLTFDFEVCPFCNATSVSDLLADLRNSISGSLPFDVLDIFMCNLHIKQRLVENLIAYMASAGSYKELILKNLQSIGGLDTFSYREYKIRYNEKGIPTNSIRSGVKSSMLSGDQCNTILNNYTKIIIGVEENTRVKYEQLFKLLNNIIFIIEMKQDDKDENQILTDEYFVMLEKLIIEFLKISYSIWAKGVKSHYFHYIIHLPSMMKRLKEMGLSLAMISNQGFERSHLAHHAVFTRVMNNGGGKNPIPITKQLIQWQWRKVELAIDLHKRKGQTFWGEKKIKNKSEWPEDKKKKSSKKLKFISSLKYDANGKISTLVQFIKESIAKAEEEEKKRIEESSKKRSLDETKEAEENSSFIKNQKQKQQQNQRNSKKKY